MLKTRKLKIRRENYQKKIVIKGAREWYDFNQIASMEDRNLLDKNMYYLLYSLSLYRLLSRYIHNIYIRKAWMTACLT